eukprot:CAMPEP_0182428648 /NCGR_PEP_ID=MMETSP1167-20130531/23177_1 /TAXON_ID=2988 /ORGANISM="Mallomonas Sp, Strain CCMP3275" /LENGTH=76 /DNA_ID=CAMNT_0024611651 /DNA_START=136 /DNA_END=362 /DNA_ORIENTATION=+
MSKKVKGVKVGWSQFAAPSADDALANLPSAPDPSREPYDGHRRGGSFKGGDRGGDRRDDRNLQSENAGGWSRGERG